MLNNEYQRGIKHYSGVPFLCGVLLSSMESFPTTLVVREKQLEEKQLE